ncbi:hypothetical protein Tco_0458318 [Tanacetum coccineum]
MKKDVDHLTLTKYSVTQHAKDVMEQKCGSTAICFVAFLPNMLDSKAEGRNKYLETLYSSVWDVTGKHPSLENHVGVGGYGYPALIT